jgi:hypothetical protein
MYVYIYYIYIYIYIYIYMYIYIYIHISISNPSTRAYADFILKADENPVNPRRECCGSSLVYAPLPVEEASTSV